MASTTRWLAGDRQLLPDGSIRLEAISRNPWLLLPMVGSALVGLWAVIQNEPVVGVLALPLLPFIFAAGRRRTFVFDVTTKTFHAAGSGTPLSHGFNSLRVTLTTEKPNGPRLLTVNGEALCWVAASYANRELESELSTRINGA